MRLDKLLSFRRGVSVTAFKRTRRKFAVGSNALLYCAFSACGAPAFAGLNVIGETLFPVCPARYGTTLLPADVHTAVADAAVPDPRGLWGGKDRMRGSQLCWEGRQGIRG